MWAAAGPRTLSDPGRAAALASAGIGQPNMITSSISAAGNPDEQGRGQQLAAFSSAPASTSGAGLSGSLVPAEPGAQVRLLSLLTHRLSAAPSLETLSQLVDATSKVMNELPSKSPPTVLVHPGFKTCLCTSTPSRVVQAGYRGCMASKFGRIAFSGCAQGCQSPRQLCTRDGYDVTQPACPAPWQVAAEPPPRRHAAQLCHPCSSRCKSRGGCLASLGSIH